MRKLAVAAALLLAACGDPLLRAELEIPSVKVTLPSQSFPALTGGVPCPPPDAALLCVDQALDFDLGSDVSVLNEKGVTSEVRVTGVSMKLASALSDFGKVHWVRLNIAAPALPDVLVASYLRPAVPQSPPPTTIAVDGYSNVDLWPYLQAGVLDVRASIAYESGTPDFTADVTSDFYLKVKLDYAKAAGL